MNLKCFVASAFDHKDVDEIYDKTIRPVLREFNIKSLRVDRVEHNEDIDDQIFDLIDKSQMCIADLTYARPSVYYEAGYAFGSGKPVIYLSRRDHLHPRQDDHHGNFRVHFDLQMKNIIDWTEPNETFKKRLRSRLKHVLRPILSELQASRAKHEIEKRFALISQVDRTAAIFKKGMSLLRARGYRRGDSPTIGPGSLRMNPSSHLQKRINSTGYNVYILVRTTMNKSTIEDIRWLWHLSTGPQLRNKLEQIMSLCVVVTFRNVKPATLINLLPHWTPKTERIFKLDEMQQFITDVPHTAMVAMIDGIRSVEDFADRFLPIVSEFENGQQEA